MAIYQNTETLDNEMKICLSHRSYHRYSLGAYQFIFESFDFAITGEALGKRKKLRRKRSAAKVKEGIVEYANDQFGFLAGITLQKMNLESNEDILECLSLLINVGALFSNNKNHDLDEILTGEEIKHEFVPENYVIEYD